MDSKVEAAKAVVKKQDKLIDNLRKINAYLEEKVKILEKREQYDTFIKSFLIGTIIGIMIGLILNNL